MLETVIVILHLLAALSIIGLVLVQHGKGADMGASFGSGASTTVFGSQGSANFLSRTTAVIVAVFFVTSIGLAYYAKEKSHGSLFDKTTPAITQPIQTDTTQTATESTNQVKVETPEVDHTPAPAGVTEAAPTTTTEPVNMSEGSK